ncbi:hypothetical protein GbCGDNIH6_8302 [Granulibacter bethesdensis]|nr:hypothetical protein GbCGDNIH6_8302 [Granulibacter bethesdensis]
MHIQSAVPGNNAVPPCLVAGLCAGRSARHGGGQYGLIMAPDIQTQREPP